MKPKIIEVSIIGDLRRRDIWMVGEKKAGCLTKEWAGRCHPLGWLRNARENTLGTLSWFLVEK